MKQATLVRLTIAIAAIAVLVFATGAFHLTLGRS